MYSALVRIWWSVVLTSLALGCAPSGHQLVVQVVSDMTPIVDFDEIRVEAPAGTAPDVVLARAGAGYGRGVRVASREVPEGSLLVRVAFFRQGAEVVRAERRRRVAGAVTVVTVRVGRECIGVTCADAMASACLGGLCVSSDCTPETPENCPPGECGVTAGGAMCTPSATVCVDTTCSAEGVCVDDPRDERCAGGQVCDAVRGCVAAMSTDAGPRDAGPGDTGVTPGMDSGVDMGTDAGLTFPPPIPLWATVSLTGISGFVFGIAANNGRVFLEVGCSGEDLGGGALAGFGGLDACVAAYDGATGAYRWGRAFGSTDSEYAGGIAASASSVFATYSYFTAHNVSSVGGPLGPGPARGSGDLAVVRMDATTGDPTWAVRAGADAFGDELPGGADIAADNNVIVFAGLPVTGVVEPFVPYFTGLDPATGIPAIDVLVSGARMRTVNAMSSGSGITLVGSYSAGDFGDGLPVVGAAANAFVARFDAAGVIQWTRIISSSDYVVASDVVESAGNVFVTGAYRGSASSGMSAATGTTAAPGFDVFVAGFDGLGTPGWLVQLASGSGVQPRIASTSTFLWAVTPLNAGGFVAGVTVPVPSLAIAGLIMGSGVLQATLVVPISIVVYDVAVDASSNVLYVAGLTSGSFTFAGRPVVAPSGASVVLAFQLP